MSKPSHSLLIGFSFGLTEGVVTALGMMVGLLTGTHSRLAVIGGLSVLAFADGLSDALGIHISEESEKIHSPSEVRQAAISTFLTKVVVSLSFVIPVLLFELPMAIVVGSIWGLLLLGVFSFYIAKESGVKPGEVILEHTLAAIAVIVVTYHLGNWIAATFG